MKVIFTYTRKCTINVDASITLDELMELCSSYPRILEDSMSYEEDLDNHDAVQSIIDEAAGISPISIYDDYEKGEKLLTTINPS